MAQRNCWPKLPQFNPFEGKRSGNGEIPDKHFHLSLANTQEGPPKSTLCDRPHLDRLTPPPATFNRLAHRPADLELFAKWFPCTSTKTDTPQLKKKKTKPQLRSLDYTFDDMTWW